MWQSVSIAAVKTEKSPPGSTVRKSQDTAANAASAQTNSAALKEALNRIKLLEGDYKSLHDKRLQDVNTMFLRKIFNFLMLSLFDPLNSWRHCRLPMNENYRPVMKPSAYSSNDWLNVMKLLLSYRNDTKFLLIISRSRPR